MTDDPASPPATAAADVPAYPMARAAGCPFDPPPVLQELQVQAPISKVRLWDGSTPWLVLRHGDQRALLGDPRLSADSSHPHYPASSPGYKESQRGKRPFIKMDDPEHSRLRRMVTAPFSVKRVEALRPTIQKIVDGLIDDMLAGPCPADLVDSFALAAPSLVICEMLGVPYADHDFFQLNAKLFSQVTAAPEQGLKAQRRLVGYLDRLIGDKLSSPGNDLLSQVAERVRSAELSREEAAQMGMMLLVAGHETTANIIALGTLALLQNQDQLAIVRETDDPAVIAGAVEELLRYLPIVHGGRPRVALEDIKIGGQVIRAGEGVLLPIEMANRDPAVFPDPGRLDIQRSPRHHMAFLFGVHQCLGQNLARVELQVACGTLYRRIPTLRLATDPTQIRFKHDAIIYGVHELPVTW
ncbi:cytochrome P450 [Streptomyces sp. NPDC055299]